MARRGEPVRVAAIFEPGRCIRPVWFEHHRRQYRVVATTYCWREQEGETLFLHFTVTDGEALFELVYNLAAGTWTLKGQQAET